MHCQQVELLLDDYLAGLLAPELASKLEEHLANCGSCQTLFLPEDEEIDHRLQGDWWQAEPDRDWGNRVAASIVSRPRNLLGEVSVITCIWAGYLAAWLLFSVIWYPTIIVHSLSLIAGALRILLPIWRAVVCVVTATSFVKVTPAAFLFLLATSSLAVYGLKRLEKEGIA